MSFKYENVNSKYLNLKKFHDKKKKQYQTYARAIKQKAELLNSRVKELKLKEASMKQMVPVQEYNKLKMHLDFLNKKHQSFRNMIVNSSGNFDPQQQQQLNFVNNFQSYENLNKNTEYFDRQSQLIEQNLALSSQENLLTPRKNDMVSFL